MRFLILTTLLFGCMEVPTSYLMCKSKDGKVTISAQIRRYDSDGGTLWYREVVSGGDHVSRVVQLEEGTNCTVQE